jgi:serine/threonine-protein kinase
MVEAIDFLHKHNLKHCDLKPQNIFIREEGQNRISPVVADFGISIVMGDKTEHGTEILGLSKIWMP